MTEVKKSPAYLRNFYEYYIGKDKIKIHYRSSDKLMNSHLPLQKVQKRYIQRKKSSQLLKMRSSHSRDSAKESLSKQNQESDTGKTIRQRNFKRWQNEFHGLEYKAFKQRVRTQTANNKLSHEIKPGRKLGSKMSSSRLKNKQLESNSKQIYDRTKGVLIEYQKQLVISEGQRKKLEDQNAQLRQIVTEYMNLK